MKQSSESRKAKISKKEPLSDRERHERFLNAAQEVEAAEDSESFDRAFARVVTPPKPKN